jgi:Ca-activated chloride channel family protein
MQAGPPHVSRAVWWLVAVLLVSTPGCRGSWSVADLWLTRDQQATRAFERGEYADAAALFEDPMWKATALYLSEQFEAAGALFAQVDSAEAWFGRGNALAHLEKYEEAIAAYERALVLRPDYAEAAANIEYLKPFLPLEFEGGVMGTVGRDAAADDVVYDADADRLKDEGRETTVEEEGGLLSDAQLADMWLRQVDASPAAFLRAKFRYQEARNREGD